MTFLFKAGGALTEDHARIYIERQADVDALAHLCTMDYLLILEPRQQGKTSLLARLRAKCDPRHSMFGYVDLEGLGYESEQAWFAGLWNELSIYLGCSLEESVPIPPRTCQEWRDCLRALAQFAEARSSRIVIALDEVGTMAKANWAELFFVSLREFYNQRAFAPMCKRVTFILAGAFHPRDLITDDKISPFNVAQRVRLPDFTLQQVRELVSKGYESETQADALSKRIHYWTDGQPYLTQLICSYLEADATPASVDAAVKRLRRDDENHLPPLLKRLNADAKLFEYTARVLSGERIKFYPGGDRRQAQLELLGVFKADAEGYCTIRNRIYELALQETTLPLDPSPVVVAQPQNEFRYDGFISYSHKDKDWVRDILLPLLELEGLCICIDYRDFEIGVPSLINMENAVEQSRKTLLILTPEWVSSEWTEFEALLVQTKDPAGRGRRILPVMVKPCSLPKRLQVFTYLDLTDPAQFDLQMQRLVAAIRNAPLRPVMAESTRPPTHIPSPDSKTLGFSPERGLDALEVILVHLDIETRLAFAVLQSRLLDNLRDERLYGSTEIIRSDRARIIQELNRLALTHVGRSFNELCGA